MFGMSLLLTFMTLPVRLVFGKIRKITAAKIITNMKAIGQCPNPLLPMFLCESTL
jgi:hypothetical protein